MKNRNIKEILFYFSLIFIMIISLNLAVMDSTGADLRFATMALFTLVTITAVSMVIIIPITFLLILAAIIGRTLYLFYTDAALLNHYIQEAVAFFNWLYGYILGFNYFEPDYSFLFVVLYAFLITLIVSLIVFSGRGSFVLILLGTAALSFFWFIYVEKARLYLLLFLFAAILLYSYQIYKKRLKEWRKSNISIEQNVGRNWMLCSSIVVIFSLILSLALPLNISPVRWPWLNDKVVSLFPFIAEWRNDTMESSSYGFNSRFSLNSVGFKGEKLGGNVFQDASVMMTVRTAGKDTLYLRGIAKDKYFDSRWGKSRKSYKEYSTDYQMPLPYGNNVNTYGKTIEITYKKLLTSTIFAPYSVYQVQHKSKRIYVDEDSELYTPKMTMKDESYTVRSIMPYINVSKLRQAQAENLSVNEFKLYTAVASDIPERVRLLAKEITKGQNNNYDRAKAIEKYLRQNYKYNLKPPKLPSDAEFTDYFLFEGKEGHCTYFATSMSVLLRAVGVPCRYVEGFIARYEGEEEREVRGTDAHAWVEVHFDDYGWVTFEPTPAYPAIEFAKPADKTAEVKPEASQDTTKNNIDLSDLSGRRKSLEIEKETAGGTAYGDGKKHFNIANIIMLMILALLAARFVCMYLMWVMKEIGLGRSKGRKFAIAYIKNLIWYLKRAGFTMSQEETLREFLKRVKYNYDEKFFDIPQVTVILEKTRYSDQELTSGERKVLEVFRKKVKKLALKKAGVVQFFISLYILGR